MIVSKESPDDRVKFQYEVYDFDAFIADVGGFLGLLLGQSIFGIYEIIINWLRFKMKCGKNTSTKVA